MQYCYKVAHGNCKQGTSGGLSVLRFVQAEEDGVACVEHICGKGGHVDYNTVPGIVYTHPEVASVGKTEEQCKQEGIAVKVSITGCRQCLVGWHHPLILIF